MKRLIITFSAIFFISFNAFALSGDRKNIEFQSCYINALNDGSTKKFANDYCRCFADKIDGKYTDNQLDYLVSKGLEYMTSKIKPLAKKCYDKLS